MLSQVDLLTMNNIIVAETDACNSTAKLRTDEIHKEDEDSDNQ